MVYFVFIKTPDQLIALLGFVVLGYILMQMTSKLKERKKTMPMMVLLGIAVNCGESFTCVS